MTYSLFVIVCLAIHVLINIDIFRKKQSVNLPALKSYRVFVLATGVYFLVDALWGIFHENKLGIALYVDTVIYFLIMGFSILCWARYLVKYVGEYGKLGKAVMIIGNLFFFAEIVLLIINIFVPIFFRVDFETAAYTGYRARNIMLYVQVLLYFILTVYSIVMAFRVEGIKIRRRYGAIASYSIIMGAAISVQVYFSESPIYSIGYIIGGCLLHSFVINGIKEEYRIALEESQVMVKKGQAELSETKIIAYSDPLTGIRNKYAYVEEEERIDKLIAKGEMEDFAVVVFDLNGLKHINDTQGHDAGDAYIIKSCHTIEHYFGKDNLYRFGGDEFVIILKGELYKNRHNLLNRFESFIDNSVNTDLPVISSGMSRFKKETDNTYHAVFNRADKIMYSRKDVLKEHQSN